MRIYKPVDWFWFKFWIWGGIFHHFGRPRSSAMARAMLQ